MRLPNVLKAEHSGWVRLIAPRRHLLGDGLKRNVREGKLRGAEDEAAEEGKVYAACHLQERVEVGDRIETAQPTSQTCAATTAQHPEGIEDGAVADEVKHRINALSFSDAFREIAYVNLRTVCAEPIKPFKALSISRACHDLFSCFYRHV